MSSIVDNFSRRSRTLVSKNSHCGPKVGLFLLYGLHAL